MAVNAPAVPAITQTERKGRSLWSDSWRQLRKNKLAMPSVIFLVVITILAIFADTALFNFFSDERPTQLLAPYHYSTAHFAYVNEPPLTQPETGPMFWLGVDDLGRDILSRTLYGARISLAVAVVAAVVSLIVGVVYGMVSGFASSKVDNFMMRIVDFLYGFPIIIFIILMQVYFKSLSRRQSEGIGELFVSIDKSMGGMFFLFIAIGLVNWLGMARIARGQTLSYKKKEFVEAARAVGSSDRRIISKHLLPNILGPCIVAETLAIPGYIFLEAFLSFIGLGVNPPTPSWGAMISEAYPALSTFPHRLFVPAIALTLTTLAFNFLGDGLRDAFDPRLRGD